MPDTNTSFPGGSRQRVNRAGVNVRKGSQTQEDITAINNWRTAHRQVINLFQAILRNRRSHSQWTRDKNIIVAQRHKRKNTIFDKLRRYPKMQLARMDDVAGCRVIFPDMKSLHRFRDEIHNARFNHILKNEKGKYDYIRNPKGSGYRSIHDVYSYNVHSSAKSYPINGLLIEIQYRTKPQHAWATANELIGLLTINNPKFGRGDRRYQRIMQLTSEIIARTAENMTSCLPDATDKGIVDEFKSLDSEINLFNLLRGLNRASGSLGKSNNFILISDEHALEIKAFRTAISALSALLDLESEYPGKDIVLVGGDNPEDIRESFKNYFSDAGYFLSLIGRGLTKLRS